MRFFSTFVIGLFGLVTAAPINEKRWPSGSILTPTKGYIYHQVAVHPPPDYIPKIQGVISYADQTSEVHVFNLPTNWVGAKVEVHFWYNEGSVSPNTAVDIFSSWKLPPSDGIGSNNRDQHLARFYVQPSGDATIKATDPGPSGWKSYQLPAGVSEVAFEAAGVGNNPSPTKLTYELATSGVYLKKIN